MNLLSIFIKKGLVHFSNITLLELKFLMSEINSINETLSSCTKVKSTIISKSKLANFQETEERGQG